MNIKDRLPILETIVCPSCGTPVKYLDEFNNPACKCGKLRLLGQNRNIIDFKPYFKYKFPQVSESEFGKIGKPGAEIYFDNLYENFFSKSTWYKIFRTALIAEIVRRYAGGKRGKDKIVANLGAGKCELDKILLSSKSVTNIIAVDILKGIYRVANENPLITVIRANILSKIFVEESIDVMICSHVIEHNTKENGMRLLDNIYKALKMNGILILGLPNGDLEKRSPDDPTHISSYSYQEIRDKIEKSGFEILVEYGTFYSDRILQGLNEWNVHLYDNITDVDSRIAKIWMESLISMMSCKDSKEFLFVCRKVSR